MPLIKSIAQAFWRSIQVTFAGKKFPVTTATAWDSMVLAASEEWVDETVFRFMIPLQGGMSHDDLAALIVDRAITHPDLNELQRDISERFLISEQDALTAIDRALGGICRAATLWLPACPDPRIDPVAAAAFTIAIKDHSIIDTVYPGWTQWRPGYHSESNQTERADAAKRLTSVPDPERALNNACNDSDAD